MEKYQDVANVASTSGASMPRMGRIEDQVLVPALQTLAWLVIVAWGLLWGAVAVQDYLTQRRVNPLLVAVAVLAGPAAYFWHERLGVAQETLYNYEEATQTDINQDGTIGHPATRNAEQARAKADNYRQQEAERKYKGELADFVRRCRVKGTSESAHRITPANRDEFGQKRDKLIELGVAEWVNPAIHKAGWRIVVEPAVARQIIMDHVFVVRK